MGNHKSKTKASPLHFTWKNTKNEINLPNKLIEESSVMSRTSSDATPVQAYSTQDFDYDNAASNELDSNDSRYKQRQRRRRNKNGNLMIKPYDPMPVVENTLQHTPRLSEQIDISIDNTTQLVYVTDCTNNCVQVFSQSLEYLFHFPRWEIRPSSDVLKSPSGITIVGNRIYVSENRRSEIAVFTLDGDYIGRIDRTFLKDSRMRMKNPNGLASDSEGNIYVCDSLNKRILIFTQDMIPICLELGKYRLVRPLGIQIQNNRIFVLDRELGQMAVKIFNKNGRFLNKIRRDVTSGLMTVDKENRIILNSISDKTVTVLREDGSCIKKVNTNKKQVFSPLEHDLSPKQTKVISTQETGSGENKLVWVNV